MLLQTLEPQQTESIRHGSYREWLDVSRGITEALDEIHVSHMRLMWHAHIKPHVRLHPPQWNCELMLRLLDVREVIREVPIHGVMRHLQCTWVGKVIMGMTF